MYKGLELIAYGLATIILTTFSYMSDSVIIKLIFITLAIACLIKSSMIGIPTIRKMINDFRKKG